MTSSSGQEVAVVTGGAIGIGAAIAEELGRQGAFVVIVDPGLKLDGSSGGDMGERTTAERIVDAGGQARSSNVSVTDSDALDALFAGLVDEFGSLDTVVNPAGIVRGTNLASGTEDDWRAVIDVHFGGYLKVLRAALPLMARAGHGRILGVTSGSGWRAADAGAYSCAKRAVAALTWQLGRVAPRGVTINALSPIAATRMVTSALANRPGRAPRDDVAQGNLSLGFAPPPEHLGPIGAYLAGEPFAAACNGKVMFTNGAELAWVTPPRLIEMARTTTTAPLPQLVDTLVPAVLAPAEAAQVTTGGGNPRIGAQDAVAAPGAGRCAIVADTADWRAAIAGALDARGIETTAIDPALGFDAVRERLGQAGSIDGVVVALAGNPPATGDAPAWQRVLDEHVAVSDQLHADCAWARAVADQVNAAGRPLRIVSLVDGTSSSGRTRAQAAAQVSRAARITMGNRVDAFAISVEGDDPHAIASAAALAAHLVGQADADALSGAELAVTSEWIGLRSHPRPTGTISYGGPDLPDWLHPAVCDLTEV